MEFLRLLAGLRNPVLDSFMLGVSYLGTPYVVLGIFLWFYLNVDKEEAYGMGLSFCFSCLLCQAVKVAMRVPRPWNLDTTFEPVSAAVSSASGYSFPSVHTQSSAAVFGSIFYYNKKKAARIISLVMLGLVAFSRMYLGCHTPGDVFAGLLAGAVTSAIVWFFWNKARHEKRTGDVLAFFLLAFGILLILLTAALLFNATIDYANSTDGFQTAGASIGFAIALIAEPRTLRFAVKGTLPRKLMRFAIAFAGTMLISFLIKAIPTSTTFPFIVLRYASMLLFMMLGAPWIFLKTGLMERMEAPLRTPRI